MACKVLLFYQSNCPAGYGRPRHPSGFHEDADLVVRPYLADHLSYVHFHVGEIIPVQSPFEYVAGKHFQKTLQLRDAALGGRIVLCPVFQVFFRPEEKHGASGIGDIIPPLGHRQGDMPDNPCGVGVFDYAVTHVDEDRFSTVQARGRDADFFPRKEPADRQRFERSLGKPLLLSIYADPELGRLVVERSEG